MSENVLKFGPNSGFIDELYELYKTDPRLVGKAWAEFFEGGDGGFLNGTSQGSTTNGPLTSGVSNLGVVSGIPSEQHEQALETQSKVARLIGAYRTYGHYAAAINPLQNDVLVPPNQAELHIDGYGFTAQEYDQGFICDSLKGERLMSLREIVAALKDIYCGSVGFEWVHVADPEQREWLRARIEAKRKSPQAADQIRRFHQLYSATLFESELHRKYIGAKRFSLEGGESLIPMLEAMVECAGQSSVAEVVIGMAHRGRLNVLAHVMERELSETLLEFDDRTLASSVGAGDVKYHLGFESKKSVNGGGHVSMRLAPNPSHLEFVNPVVEGICRALQDKRYEGKRHAVMPLLIHGDAAFIGQGVVTETLNYSQVDGFHTGGTIHVVVNNQVGFTATADETRSTFYCTDFAKALGVPVFHVNAEDVDAVCEIAALAVDYRNAFGRDVVVDLNCYRKYGHNEGDDPSYTQPLSSKEIKAKRSIASIYSDKLKQSQTLNEEQIASFEQSYKDRFAAAAQHAAATVIGDACALHGRPRVQIKPTAIPAENLVAIAQAAVNYPDWFTPHPKLAALMQKRVDSLTESGRVDWGTAEALSFGTLLQEGVHIRLSGQDCRRGTFSHRHAVLDDYEKGGVCFSPLTTVGSGEIEIYNSVLSEAGVLGFEFGYASVTEKSLVMWEAQFGDFANGAQVIIDQFISSSEAKWDQQSSVVLLLPHGYEGQGPEHSSARLERFLQLCADGNMEVCVPSSAEQYFHLLRSHMHSSLPRPLIVMTPKSLLRLPEATSPLSDFTHGKFDLVLSTDYGQKKPSKVLCMSGKVYYDVHKALVNEQADGVRVIRLERLHPFPFGEIRELLHECDNPSVAWVQEEPMNQGAWSFVESRFEGRLVDSLRYIGRPVSSSTATGSPYYHNLELQRILTACSNFVK